MLKGSRLLQERFVFEHNRVTGNHVANAFLLHHGSQSRLQFLEGLHHLAFVPAERQVRHGQNLTHPFGQKTVNPELRRLVRDLFVDGRPGSGGAWLAHVNHQPVLRHNHSSSSPPAGRLGGLFSAGCWRFSSFDFL